MDKSKMRVVAVGCGILGASILAYVLFPIVSYELNSPSFESYLSPIPENAIAAEGQFDSTKASTWFTGSKESDFEAPVVSYYSLTIPKLGIKKATVSIGGEDLAKNLIQYPGTAVPGKLGNAVVFGHSVLPQFFNPSDYMTIFSTLPKLSTNDDIYIDYDGVSYHYRVEDKFEVNPTDIQILQQNPADSFLTLVTCSPPGNPFTPRRLIIRARVVPFGES